MMLHVLQALDRPNQAHAAFLAGGYSSRTSMQHGGCHSWSRHAAGDALGTAGRPHGKPAPEGAAVPTHQSNLPAKMHVSGRRRLVGATDTARM